MLHLIFILIFFIVILNVLGKIARSAKKLQPREKTSGGGLLDSIGKAFNASARNEAWMKAAGDLGLSFVRPSTVYDTPSIAGRIEGFEISVFTEHDPDKTIYRITFPKNIDIGFLAMRDEAVTMLNRQFSGRKRLDKILNLLPDDLVNSAVSAYEEKALNRFLTKERRDALLRCLRLYENVKIDDNSLAVTYNGIEGNPEKLCARINTALMFARIFGCDTEPLPTPPSAAAHSNDIRNPEAIKAEPKAIKAERRLSRRSRRLSRRSRRLSRRSRRLSRRSRRLSSRRLSRRSRRLSRRSRRMLFPPPLPHTHGIPTRRPTMNS